MPELVGLVLSHVNPTSFAPGPCECSGLLGRWSVPNSGLLCLQWESLCVSVPEEVCCSGLTVMVAGGARPCPPGTATSFCVGLGDVPTWPNSIDVVSPVHLAPKKGPKQWQLVHDLHGINTVTPLQPCKFETLKVLSPCRIRLDGHLDLAQGYHHMLMGSEVHLLVPLPGGDLPIH
jgi:hypothetical protein